MSGVKYDPNRMTQAYASRVREVRDWLSRQPGDNALAIDVLTETADRIDAYVHTRMILTIRAKNLGTAKKAKVAHVARTPIEQVGGRQNGEKDWNDTELEALRELMRSRVPYKQMEGMIPDRTWQACRAQARRLGLTYPPAAPRAPLPLTPRQTLHKRPILQVAREVRERRLERERKMSHG